MMAPVRWIAEGGTFVVHYILLGGNRILATVAYNSHILGLHQSLVVSLVSSWMGMVVELGSTWKWRLRRRVTIPRWWRKLICGLPEWSVFVRCISSMIIWCSHIVIWALLWAKLPTRRSHIGCLRWRSIGRHRMWTKDGTNQRINSIGDFEWSGV